MKAFLQKHYLKPHKNPEQKKKRKLSKDDKSNGKLRSPCNDTSWFFNKRAGPNKVLNLCPAYYPVTLGGDSGEANALSSLVRTTPGVVSGVWWVAFFAPWSTDSIAFKKTFKKFSKRLGNLKEDEAKFVASLARGGQPGPAIRSGAVDCVLYESLCLQLEVGGANGSYPVLKLYAQGDSGAVGDYQLWDYAYTKQKGVDAMVAFTKRKLIDRALTKGLERPEIREQWSSFLSTIARHDRFKGVPKDGREWFELALKARRKFDAKNVDNS